MTRHQGRLARRSAARWTPRPATPSHLKLEEKTQVIKFLEDTPYANFLRHWVERTTKDGKSLRAHGCPKTVEEGLPTLRDR